jgi:hypothetical protein
MKGVIEVRTAVVPEPVPTVLPIKMKAFKIQRAEQRPLFRRDAAAERRDRINAINFVPGLQQPCNLMPPNEPVTSDFFMKAPH